MAARARVPAEGRQKSLTGRSGLFRDIIDGESVDVTGLMPAEGMVFTHSARRGPVRAVQTPAGPPQLREPPGRRRSVSLMFYNHSAA